MNRGLAVLGVLVLIAGFVAYSMLFVVPQVQQAIVLQFGAPMEAVKDPGLKFKLPWQNVVYYDKRVLDLDPPKQQVILSDQKRLDVDSYARFKIVDPLLFFQTVKDEMGARSRLSPIINSALRRVLGNETLLSILSDQRISIMASIRQQANDGARPLGMELVEVRIRRADYPEETSLNIYNRMKSEREREAKEFRAQGQEEAQKIRADADKQRVVIVAEAKKQSEMLRGQGDAEAIRIYAEAFGKDPEFFAFYRSMQAYRNAMKGGDTTMVLSPDSDFFKYFKNIEGAPAPQ
ncbi:protease modulator HflC [uncultured Nisaea sp.]|jgi:membrane protease subunit HflC|uniref:protease modulator HflC n=1 Tax=uncultured Nisaea sp. TaxID=538215 RepID=UPI0030EB554C|tara:strand:- start:29 stop:904 length:876 start_codon:yes stop_codon:yes gene_type:complete